MSYGFDFGRLKSSSTGLSYVADFYYTGNYASQSYQSPAFEFATDVRFFIMPAEDVPADRVPVFPTVSANLSTANKTITVTASGGNVSLYILVFVR
jgi:hypothetical protein